MRIIIAALFALCIFPAAASAQGTATAFGDSITVSYGVPSGQGWVPKLATTTGKTITNSAVSGAQAADQMMPIYNHTWATDEFVTYMIGVNDQWRWGTASPLFDYFKSALAAETYFLTSNTVKADALTKTGTWASNNPYTYGVSSHSTAGSTLTGTFTGPTLMVGWVLAPATSSGKFTVSVDGVVVATLDCNASFAVTTLLGAGWGPQLLRLTGFSGGSHTVVFTKLDSNYVYIDWLWQGSNGKPLYLSSITRWNAVGYATTPYGSDANTAIYNAYISALIAQMQGDGLNVTYVNAVNVVDPATDLQSDGAHPNTAIQPAIAAAFANAISGAPPPPPPPVTYSVGNIYIGSDGSHCVGLSAPPPCTPP